MRKTWVWPGLAAAAGLLGGVLRAVENQHVLDTTSGLRTPGHPLTIVMLAYCALCVLALALPFLRDKTALDGAAVFSGSRSLMLCAWLSALALGASTLYDLIRFANTYKLSLLAFAGMSFFSAVSLIPVAAAFRKGGEKGGSVAAVVPVFWACYWLIISYGEHAADPVIVDYLYTLLGESAVVVALYLFSQLSFDAKRLRSALIFALLSVFFSVLNIAEPFLGLLIYGNNELMDEFLALRIYYVFPLIFMPSVSAALLRKMKQR
jgi:hypothetical protein